MNERFKSRSKDQNQTAFQLNSRQSRNYLSGRLVSLIRANDQSGEFSAQELIQMESLLRDELQSNSWLLNVCKALTDESTIVSKEELEMSEKYKTDGKEVFVTQSEFQELQKELEFLKERLNVLRHIRDMTQKLTEIQRNDSNIEMNVRESNSVDTWLLLRTKLKESIEIITKDLSTDFSVEEPKDIVDYIITHLNEKIVTIDGIQNSNEWLNQSLDELTLTKGSKKQVLEDFNYRFRLKLEDIHKNLNNLLKECLRIQNFYEVNVKEEMSWRSDINGLINRLQALNNDSKAIELKSLKTESNELLAKKSSIEEYSQFFQKLENQEFDELQALIEAIKQRIDKLNDNTNSSTKTN